jgi:copper homeostasis protein
MVKVEVASNSVQSALAAQKGGAARVELCANLLEGGTTPAKSQIELCRRHLQIALNVIIRPRGGDFLYDEWDFEAMKKDVELCGQLGCDGVVTGILDACGNVDVERNAELVSIAKRFEMSVTFHRAFDRARDLPASLEDIIRLGCDRILTSGGYANAFDGRLVIRDLVKQAGERIIIMPGAGVTEHNAAEIIGCTGAKEIHGTFQAVVEGGMSFRSPHFADKSEYIFLQSNEERIKAVVEAVGAGECCD